MKKLILTIFACLAICGSVNADCPMTTKRINEIEDKTKQDITVRGTKYHCSSDIELKMRNVNGKHYIRGYDAENKCDICVAWSDDNYVCVIEKDGKMHTSDWFDYSRAGPNDEYGYVRFTFKGCDKVIFSIFGNDSKFIGEWMYYE